MTIPLITISDETCELKVNDSLLLVSVNKTWSPLNDPCTVYKCIRKSAGETHIDVRRIECDTTCGNDFIYKTVSSECCGKCVATFCKANDQKFKAGDIWKSVDNCTVNECIDIGTDLVVTSYKKSCPQLKNCPQESLEIRDCCPYCNYRIQSKFELKICSQKSHKYSALFYSRKYSAA